MIAQRQGFRKNLSAGSKPTNRALRFVVYSAYVHVLTD
jgi:hypothetical protein